MCGIAGVLHRDGRPRRPRSSKAMTDIIAHRGPDGEGISSTGPMAWAIAACRSSTSPRPRRQPMASADGRYVITYNGEIYNFQELRAELSARGHHVQIDGRHRGACWHAFSEWGLGAFNASTACSLSRLGRPRADADDRARSFRREAGLLRTGGRRVAVCFRNQGLPRLSRRSARGCDVEGLTEYLSFQNFFTDRTLFDGVRLLPQAATCRSRSMTTDRSSVHRYWDFHFQEPDGHV